MLLLFTQQKLKWTGQSNFLVNVVKNGQKRKLCISGEGCFKKHRLCKIYCLLVKVPLMFLLIDSFILSVFILFFFWGFQTFCVHSFIFSYSFEWLVCCPFVICTLLPNQNSTYKSIYNKTIIATFNHNLTMNFNNSNVYWSANLQTNLYLQHFGVVLSNFCITMNKHFG